MNETQRVKPWALYIGLGLTTCSMLLAQQFMTRIFTVLFNSGLAFLAISITFLGLGTAGVCAAFLPRVFSRERLPRWIPSLAGAYALCLTASVVLLVSLDARMVEAAGENALAMSEQVKRVLMGSAIMLPPMFLAGLVISLVLKAHVARVNRLYGADLLGGGLGCLLVLPLMGFLGGDHGIFWVGALAGLGAVGFAIAHYRSRAAALWLLATILLAAGPLANSDYRLVDVKTHGTDMAGVDDWVFRDREIRREWNALSRIGMFETRGNNCLYVQIDSSCQTVIPSKDPSYAEQLVAAANFEHLPYSLDHHERYLEIGAGGGNGMLIAASHGAKSITGVEINPSIVAGTLSGFEEFGIGPLVEDPEHQLVLDEGRSYVRASDELYDTVTITYIQTGVASASAAFALSEANLFTVEAFVEYLDHLTPDGLFYVYRHGGNEVLRLVALAREALGELGISDPRPHLYVVLGDNDRAVLMVKRSPFDTEELTRLDERSDELALRILYSPSGRHGALPPNPLFAEISSLRDAGELNMKRAAELYQGLRRDRSYRSLPHTYLDSDDPTSVESDYLVDISAPHDDQPYYFFFRLNRLADFGLYFDLDGLSILGGIVILLFWMLMLFIVLVSLLIALPLWFGAPKQSGGKLGIPVIAYFSALGVGYMLVQLSFVQRFVLFLGHPVYAISVVLLAFLIWTGAGAIASDRLFERRGVTLTRALVSLGLTLLLANLLLPVIFDSPLISWPIAAKIGVSLVLIFPLAFQMGFFFPRGIRFLEKGAEDLTPWAWGANSAASVLGSITALILAMHIGFSLTTAVGAGVYVFVALPAGMVLARRTA